MEIYLFSKVCKMKYICGIQSQMSCGKLEDCSHGSGEHFDGAAFVILAVCRHVDELIILIPFNNNSYNDSYKESAYRC